MYVALAAMLTIRYGRGMIILYKVAEWFVLPQIQHSPNAHWSDWLAMLVAVALIALDTDTDESSLKPGTGKIILKEVALVVGWLIVGFIWNALVHGS